MLDGTQCSACHQTGLQPEELRSLSVLANMSSQFRGEGIWGVIRALKQKWQWAVYVK